MAAWNQAVRQQRENLAGALAANASHQQLGGDSALQYDLQTRFKRYDAERKTCFFCGARAHHTGFIPGKGHGAIWLCKERCQDRYTLVLAALSA